MVIRYFLVLIVECSVYVLVFRTSNNFLCGWRFSHLATLCPEGLSILFVCEIFIITFFVIDGLVGWLRSLIVKTVIFLIAYHVIPRPLQCIFKCYQLELFPACWAHVMCHHELCPTSVSHPFCFLNASLGLTRMRIKCYQKIIILIFRLVLPNFNL